MRYLVIGLLVLLSGCKTIQWGVADIELSYKPDKEREVSVNVQIYR